MDILKRLEEMTSSSKIDGLELFFNENNGDVWLRFRDFDRKEDRPKARLETLAMNDVDIKCGYSEETQRDDEFI